MNTIYDGVARMETFLGAVCSFRIVPPTFDAPPDHLRALRRARSAVRRRGLGSKISRGPWLPSNM